MEERRLTHRGLARRKELLDVSALLFAKNGYHPTSVAQIVQLLQVGKGTFYWYFSSKEELFQARKYGSRKLAGGERLMPLSGV